MKTAYIIPGFTEGNSRAYKQIAKFFRYKKIKPVFTKITWKNRVMSQYIEEFLNQVKEDDCYVLGFSFGAMIALASSGKIKPKKLILCSLSPYFKEDLKYLKKSWKPYVGKRRLKDLENISFNKLYNTANGSILIIGSRESKELKKRVFDAHNKIKNSRLIEVKGAGHKISQKEYLNTMKEVISKL